MKKIFTYWEPLGSERQHWVLHYQSICLIRILIPMITIG